MAKKTKKQKKQKSPIGRAIGIVLKIIIALLLAREFDNLIRYEVHQSQIWLIFFVKS